METRTHTNPVTGPVTTPGTNATTNAAGSATPRVSDVVAGIANDGMAALVAAAAVHQAVQRGARVRFSQVLPGGLSTEERADLDVAMFGVALRAMHGHQRVPVTFEAVVGDPSAMLVERSDDASVLVVGRDAPDATVRVGQYCQDNARCDVLTVTGPGDTRLYPAAGHVLSPAAVAV